MQAGAIELAWIVVSDLAKAIEYYTHVLGLKLLENNEEYGWAELQSATGGARLGLAEASKEQQMHPGRNAVITINVKNIEQVREMLLKRGVMILGDIIEVPGQVKMQLFTDPDGNHMQIVEKLS